MANDLLNFDGPFDVGLFDKVVKSMYESQNPAVCFSLFFFVFLCFFSLFWDSQKNKLSIFFKKRPLSLPFSLFFFLALFFPFFLNTIHTGVDGSSVDPFKIQRTS